MPQLFPCTWLLIFFLALCVIVFCLSLMNFFVLIDESTFKKTPKKDKIFQKREALTMKLVN
uniref:ATP synthase F0 subunit 8 n=1 Tax=Ibidoecus bisignatus TaxID=236520 RepID=G1EN82_9NEOP|nr:ATP synthase F0 subunit 8 [Ibidoecus bisignatus]AEM23865.1 ATP synthase F0 subunit 8 [Ibidoecus bisignatus]